MYQKKRTPERLLTAAYTLIRLAAVLLLCASYVVSNAQQQDRQLVQADSRASGNSKRTALVIGNGAYETAPLRNPVNDAQDIAKALAELGFEVIYKENLQQNEMKRAMRAFGEKLRSRGGVGLFYYAGHGVQVKGINYLVPVGAKVESEEEVEYECVDAGFVLAQMESAANGMNIVILDACRNNPFAQRFRSVSRGLAPLDAPGGTIIAFATAPGSIASDGNARNGIYTQELLRSIREPDLSIEEVFKRVRISVRGLTQGRQTPWESSSLIGSFYFNPTGNSTAKAAAPPVMPEIKATPGNVASSISVRKSTGMKASVQAFIIELDSCRMAGGEVTCQFRVTNDSSSDREFSLCHEYYMARRRGMDTTKAIDSSGGEYIVAESVIGASRVNGSMCNKARIAPQIPVRLAVKFANVSRESEAFSLLRLAIEEQQTRRGAFSLAYADFRNVPIEK